MREMERCDDIKEVGAHEYDICGFDSDRCPGRKCDADRCSNESRRVINTISDLQGDEC